MVFGKLTLDYWDGIDSAMRTQIARIVGETLPPPFRFIGLETHALGDQRHEVALFDHDGARFALLPGGEVTLGFDRSVPFVPGPLQRAAEAEFRTYLQETGEDWPIEEIEIAAYLTLAST